MLKKLTLAMAALAVSAAFLGAGSASAATLYKTTAKISAVPVGTTFTATQPFWNGKELPTPEQAWSQYTGEESYPLYNVCMNASITFKVTQNSGGTVKAVPTAVSFPTCTRSQKWASAVGTQELSVTGSSTANGTESAWLGTKLNLGWTTEGYTWYEEFTGATGSPPAKGVFVQQPTAAKAPISINLVNAPFSFKGTHLSPSLSAKFVFTGEAAAWSLG
jgi:hypothetical protein